MDPGNFLLLALATWRLSHMLSVEDGPGDVFRMLRQVAGAYYVVGEGAWRSQRFIGQLLLCPLCLSVWLGTLLYAAHVFVPWLWPVVIVLALSGLASVVELCIAKRQL